MAFLSIGHGEAMQGLRSKTSGGTGAAGTRLLNQPIVMGWFFCFWRRAKRGKACAARLLAAPAQPEPASSTNPSSWVDFLFLETCEARHGLRSNTSGGPGQPELASYPIDALYLLVFLPLEPCEARKCVRSKTSGSSPKGATRLPIAPSTLRSDGPMGRWADGPMGFFNLEPCEARHGLRSKTSGGTGTAGTRPLTQYALPLTFILPAGSLGHTKHGTACASRLHTTPA